MSSHLLQTVQAPHGHQATSDTVALLQAPSQSPPTMAMFNGCSNITINGGTFTMAPPTEAQEDFRTIRVGDINLLSLVQEENIVENRVVLHRKRPGRVHCQKVHIATRKTYHAKIFGSQDIFTVMAYEGNLSEWKRKSAGKVLRHPNHIQLFGITDSSRMHAVIYHDELVPANDTLQRCPTSLSRRLLHYVMSIHFQAVRDYLQETHSINLYSSNDKTNWTKWFRISTGQLNVELDHVDAKSWALSLSREVESSLGTLQVFHPWQGCFSDRELLVNIAYRDLLEILCFKQPPLWKITPSHGPIQLATVYTDDTPWWESVHSFRKICSLPSSYEFVYSDNEDDSNSSGGWKRFQYDEIQKLESGFMFFYFVRFKDEDGKNMAQSWLADSNTLKLPAFRQAQEHVLANGYAAYMEPVPGSESWDPFQLAGTFMADAPTTTDLYLFILVPEPYIVGDGVWVDIPSCHKGYYWSLDADGYQELSDEDCLELGLPEYTIDARLQGMNFQEEDYEIIRHFRSIHGEDSEMFKEFQSHITWHDGSLLVKNLQLDESWFTSHHHWHN